MKWIFGITVVFALLGFGLKIEMMTDWSGLGYSAILLIIFVFIANILVTARIVQDHRNKLYDYLGFADFLRATQINDAKEEMIKRIKKED